MIGTWINVATVLAGGLLGLLLGRRLPARLKETVVAGLGLFTACLGVRLFLGTENPLIVLGSLLAGALLGEWWGIESGLNSLGGWLERRFAPAGGSAATDAGRGRFVRGFLTASLLFCVGPMTVLGSLQDGLSGDTSLLATKAVLDGFAALAFASSLGPGVLFSALVVLLYQGGLSLLAGQLAPLLSEGMTAEMAATGGVLLVGIAVSGLLELKPIRVGNFLPALVIAPLLAALFG